MDTSETYIKMCEKAQEILKYALVDEDYVIVTDGSQILYQGLLGFHRDPFLSPIPIIITPLFSQDKLQAMVNLKLPDITRFSKWVDGADGVGYLSRKWPAHQFDYDSPQYVFHSMEQLWLSFVMQEKYSKVWNTEDWVEMTTKSSQRDSVKPGFRT